MKNSSWLLAVSALTVREVVGCRSSVVAHPGERNIARRSLWTMFFREFFQRPTTNSQQRLIYPLSLRSVRRQRLSRPRLQTSRLHFAKPAIPALRAGIHADWDR